MSVDISIEIRDQCANMLLANTVAFISYRGRLTIMLAGAAREDKGNEGGGAE